MLTKLFHIAINSTDLDKSLEFYTNLGFNLIADRVVENPGLAEGFKVAGDKCRFAHLRLGDSDDATLLDIVEWIRPKTEGQAVRLQNQRGISRFAVLTDDTDKVYEELSAKGVEFMSTPTTVMTEEGGWRVCLALDPDGTVVQVTQLLPA